MLERVTFKSRFELMKKFKGIFDIFESVEVVVNEVLQLDV